MQLESAEDLMQALRASGLFTPEQFEALVRELGELSTDPAVVVKQLVKSARVTRYQLGKVLRGKAADLRVGPYVVTDKLGAGGMGKVYRGRFGGDGPTVALKVVRAALVANPTVRGRYAREVQTASSLDHPNIVRVLDAGEADGKFYMAMQFVDGIDLARLMHEFGKLEVAEACEYVRQAALGLRHAHEHGFVHRDIKPSNIVVAGERHLPQATEPAVVKILDLGLARAIDPDDMVAPDLTRDHTVVGTPDYMAPEQAKNSKSVDARADLYSLGCTLYYLLTGRVPFTGATAIEKILAHQSELPPPVQALRPEVPAAVAELVARLMTKRPEDRMQTAAELVAAITPHARYAPGAPAVEVVSARERAGGAAPPAGSRTGDTGGPRSTFPSSSSMGALAGPISPLGFSLDDPEPGPKGQPVAPSDNTPRPVGLDLPAADGGPAPRRPTRRRRSRPRSYELHWPLWVALALAGIGVLVGTLWLVSNR